MEKMNSHEIRPLSEQETQSVSGGGWPAIAVGVAIAVYGWGHVNGKDRAERDNSQSGSCSYNP